MARKGEAGSIDFGSNEEKQKHWHSTSHMLAAAVKKLWPNVKLAIGPAIEAGFYYDFDGRTFSEKDLEKIEDEMKKIIKADAKFERSEISKSEARKIFKNEKYKLELIDDIEGDKVTIYKTGEFVDLCAGPHVTSSGKIGAVKLLKVSGSYWRGDVKNTPLQRIYGISFPSQKELDAYLKLLEEAEKRDHRKIGQQLDLFSLHEEGVGFPFWHNKGWILRNILVEFWRKKHREAGYQEVNTPIMLNKKLWETSGHWDNYRELMYFTQVDDIDYGIKPMNCAGGILIYKEKKHSYREFPLRIGELGLVHRHELSGVVSGLFRVRSFTQDDAHIYCLPEQAEQEINNVIELMESIYSAFGINEYEIELSTRPEKSVGTNEMWETATNILKRVLEKRKIKYEIDKGAGVFYGPKIDVKIKDSLGRKWQCATIQLDFNFPDRFDLTYTGADGKEHRPVMIHRTLYGALERFIGILIEHYTGAFPVWLAPVQVIILPMTDKNIDYGQEVKKELEKNGARVEIDCEPNTLEYKIRNAQLQKLPYMIVVGEKEIKNNTIAVRSRDGKVKYGVKIKDFIKQIEDEVENKK